jgi:hypothetical protein
VGKNPAGYVAHSPTYGTPSSLSSKLLGQPVLVLERALVIIPTYNESDNLPRLVPSVLSRDPRLEILVVDDNSPDGTGRMADEIAATEPRLHVLHRPGRWVSAPRTSPASAGGSSAKYDVIFEMDADFSHDPAHLPQFLDAIEATTWCSAPATWRGASPSSTGPSGGSSSATSPTPTPAG